MAHGDHRQGIFWGGLLILIGVLFLLDNFYYLDIGDIISTYWPLILIGFGIKILLDRQRTGAMTDQKNNVQTEGHHSDKHHNSDVMISESNVFGDIDINPGSGMFYGGSVNNVFGDMRLDISQAQLAEGTTRIQLNGVFGDIMITTPKNIPVSFRGNAVAGDLAVRGQKRDGLFPNLQFTEENFSQAAQKLEIRCSVVFGSVTVF